MKKTLLFLGHYWHEKTKSHEFFAEILKRRFDITFTYIDPSIVNDFKVHDTKYDYVLLWQVDYLAPIFISKGFNTIIVPMYDGSSTLPDIHWICAGACKIINFSRTLNEKCRLLRLNSLLLKYFPEPKDESELDSGANDTGLFWRRRPAEGIDLKLINKLFGPQLKVLNVHNSPDNSADAKTLMESDLRLFEKTSISTWSNDKSEYLNRLRASGVYIAPRPSEGIGMGFLEAMAHGKLVVAPDHPTHNEYISNWLNGVLYDINSVNIADFSNIKAMRYMAWKTVQEGHGRWVESHPNLLEFIASDIEYDSHPAYYSNAFAEELQKAYITGADYYSNFLQRIFPWLIDEGYLRNNNAARTYFSSIIKSS